MIEQWEIFYTKPVYDIIALDEDHFGFFDKRTNFSYSSEQVKLLLTNDGGKNYRESIVLGSSDTSYFPYVQKWCWIDSKYIYLLVDSVYYAGLDANYNPKLYFRTNIYKSTNSGLDWELI